MKWILHDWRATDATATVLKHTMTSRSKIVTIDWHHEQQSEPCEH